MYSYVWMFLECEVGPNVCPVDEEGAIIFIIHLSNSNFKFFPVFYMIKGYLIFVQVFCQIRPYSFFWLLCILIFVPRESLHCVFLWFWVVMICEFYVLKSSDYCGGNSLFFYWLCSWCNWIILTLIMWCLWPQIVLQHYALDIFSLYISVFYFTLFLGYLPIWHYWFFFLM